MAKEVLGEFEHDVLVTALRLEPVAYTAAIVMELDTRARRAVAPAAVHIALQRLTDAGLAKSQLRIGDGAAGRRERRYVTVTPQGVALLRSTRQRLLRLWEGLEPRLGTS